MSSTKPPPLFLLTMRATRAREWLLPLLTTQSGNRSFRWPPAKCASALNRNTRGRALVLPQFWFVITRAHMHVCVCVCCIVADGCLLCCVGLLRAPKVADRCEATAHHAGRFGNMAVAFLSLKLMVCTQANSSSRVALLSRARKGFVRARNFCMIVDENSQRAHCRAAPQTTMRPAEQYLVAGCWRNRATCSTASHAPPTTRARGKFLFVARARPVRVRRSLAGARCTRCNMRLVVMDARRAAAALSQIITLARMGAKF